MPQFFVKGFIRIGWGVATLNYKLLRIPLGIGKRVFLTVRKFAIMIISRILLTISKVNGISASVIANIINRIKCKYNFKITSTLMFVGILMC